MKFLKLIFFMLFVKKVFLSSPVCVEKNVHSCRADNWNSIFNVQKYRCLTKLENVKNELERLKIQKFNCSILSVESEDDCRRLESKSKTFFNDANSKVRIANSPDNYFKTISSTAFKEITLSESKTPLAFSILCHNNIGQLEALLTSIFRPQNSYCIYMDAKALPTFKESVESLVRIFRKTFPHTTLIVANPTRRIYWSDVSILEAGLDCLQQLLKANSKWKFFLNTVGTALPGFRIQEIAEAFSHLEGDVVASIPMPEKVKKYVEKKLRLPMKAESAKMENFETGEARKFQYHRDVVPFRTLIRKGPPPHGLKLFYNMTESVLSRQTATFLLNNKIANDFREWVQDIMAPEEFFYATLARVNQTLAQDSSIVQQDELRDTTQGICPRYSNWDSSTCGGKMKRWICNLGLEDLPEAISRKCIWINKFDLKSDPRPVLCLHQFLTS